MLLSKNLHSSSTGLIGIYIYICIYINNVITINNKFIKYTRDSNKRGAKLEFSIVKPDYDGNVKFKDIGVVENGRELNKKGEKITTTLKNSDFVVGDYISVKVNVTHLPFH